MGEGWASVPQAEKILNSFGSGTGHSDSRDTGSASVPVPASLSRKEPYLSPAIFIFPELSHGPGAGVFLAWDTKPGLEEESLSSLLLSAIGELCV